MHNAIASVVMSLEKMFSCNRTKKSGATALLRPCVIDPKSRMAWTQKAETGQLFQHANTKHKKSFEQTVQKLRNVLSITGYPVLVKQRKLHPTS